MSIARVALQCLQHNHSTGRVVTFHVTAAHTFKHLEVVKSSTNPQVCRGTSGGTNGGTSGGISGGTSVISLRFCVDLRVSLYKPLFT